MNPFVEYPAPLDTDCTSIWCGWATRQLLKTNWPEGKDRNPSRKRYLESKVPAQHYEQVRLHVNHVSDLYNASAKIDKKKVVLWDGIKEKAKREMAATREIDKQYRDKKKQSPFRKNLPRK